MLHLDDKLILYLPASLSIVRESFLFKLLKHCLFPVAIAPIIAISRHTTFERIFVFEDKNLNMCNRFNPVMITTQNILR